VQGASASFIVEVFVTLTRSSASRLVLLVLLALVASGCSVIGGVFKAGIWAGAIIVILVVLVIVFIVSRARS
jgi:hypothetical protein